MPKSADVVTRVDVEGAPAGLEGELEAGLSTRKSPKFLGLFYWFSEYETLDRAALARDLERIERQLQRRGYYEARVTAARIVREDEQKVRVEIQVEHGEPVRLRSIRLTGLARVAFEASAAATEAMTLRQGDIFDEDEFEKAKSAMARALASHGYAFAEVDGKAKVHITSHAADVDLQVKAGKSSVYGPVNIEGLGDLAEGPVRDALQIEEGDEYSLQDLEIARSAVSQLGTFSQIQIVPHLDDPDSGVVPITVRLTPSALRSVQAGVGVSLDVLRFAASLNLSWEHRNFLGGLRTLSINDRPGLTFYPTRIDFITTPTRILPENSLNVRLDQPSFLEGRTTGYIDTAYNIYPLLYPLPEGADPNQERIIGYNEIAWALGMERIFWGRHLPVTLSYNWQANFPFTYQGNKVAGLDTVIVSYPELSTIFDFRDDPLNTTSGGYVSNSFQIATPLIDGTVSDIRIRPEARAFVPVNYAKTVILAARVTLGFVFPFNYGDTLDPDSPEFVSVQEDPTNPAVVADQHKLQFRAFYSGGPNSNRGYPYRRVGPQGPVGFLIPTGEDCDPTNPDGSRRDLPNTCIRPLGGFSLWEASLELRFPISDPWGMVAFADTSNVSTQVADLALLAPHLSVGTGLRYASAIGPVRVDLGFRVPGLQLLKEEPNVLDVSQVEPFVSDAWYQSFTLNVLIGEAF